MVHTFRGTQNECFSEKRVFGTSKCVNRREKNGKLQVFIFFRNFVCDVYFAFFEYIAPPQHTKRSLKLNSTRNFGRKRMHTRLLRLLVPKKSKRKIEKNLKYLAQRQMSLAQTFVSGPETNVSGTDVCLWHRDKCLWAGRSCR